MTRRAAVRANNCSDNDALEVAAATFDGAAVFVEVKIGASPNGGGGGIDDASSVI
jgi:hypothetical protein